MGAYMGVGAVLQRNPISNFVDTTQTYQMDLIDRGSPGNFSPTSISRTIKHTITTREVAEHTASFRLSAAWVLIGYMLQPRIEWEESVTGHLQYCLLLSDQILEGQCGVGHGRTSAMARLCGTKASGISSTSFRNICSKQT